MSELEDLQNQRASLRRMLESDGWNTFVSEFLEPQIQVREDMEKTIDVVEDPHALSKIIELRAEYRTLQLILEYPFRQVEFLDAEIEQLIKENPDASSPNP